MCVCTHTVSYWGIVINATGISFLSDSDDHTPFQKNMGQPEMACHHVSLKLQVWDNHYIQYIYMWTR